MGASGEDRAGACPAPRDGRRGFAWRAALQLSLCGVAALLHAADAGVAAALQPVPAGRDLESRVATLNDLVASGRYAEADPLAVTIVAEFEDTLGPDDAQTLVWIAALGQIRIQQGRNAEAEPLLRRALEGQRRTLGEDDRAAIMTGNALATALQNLGRYQEAKAVSERSLAAADRSIGADDPATLVMVNNLAGINRDIGLYAEAERLHLRAATTSERVLGRDHPDTLFALSDLARLYEAQGRIQQAETLGADVLARRERELGAEHPDTLTSKNNLAGIYLVQGRYAEAEALLVGVLQARERLLGSDHLLTITSVGNLAILYDRQARYVEAEPLLLRVLAARELAQGADHPETILAVNNLALSYQRQGRFDEAEPLYVRALRASERRVGPDHPNTLVPRHNLAGLYEDQGRFGEAEPLYLEALRASERANGAQHPVTLRFAYNLAGMHVAAGAPARAEPLLRRVVDAGASVLGDANPLVLAAERRLVQILLSRDDAADAALELARRLVAGTRIRQNAEAAGVYAEAQRDREETDQGAAFSLLAEAAWSNTGPAAGSAAALRGESFAALQDAMAGPASRSIARMAVRRYAGQAGGELDERVREREALLDRWLTASGQLATTFASGDADTADLRRTIGDEVRQIETRLARLDAELRDRFPEYFSLIRPEPLDIAQAQGLLRSDEALLLAVPNARGTQVMLLTREGAEWWRSGWNAARVDDAVQRLRWDLGARVSALPETIREWQQAVDPNQAPGFDRATAFALYRELVGPGATILSGKRRLYVAAAGPLAGLPFSVLVTGPPVGPDNAAAALRATPWLADELALVHVPSVQSLALLRRAAAARPDGQRRFAGYGDPLLDGPAPQRRQRGTPVPSAAAVLTGSRTRSGGVLAETRHLRRLSRLPGTARELENLRAAFGAPTEALHLGAQATESAVRAADLTQIRVLAFATHGLTGGELSSLVEPGLVLTPPAVATELDDGYLAASDVAALRLDADWVILSACNTATGDESLGLSALARAFFYAGSRSLLASHWPVVDDVAARITVRTVELENQGVARAEAFRRASREIRMDETHDSATDSWAHPYYWAPFVLIGDGG